MAVVTAPNLRAALRVIADAAGRVLADGAEASREVRLELFERLAAAEETARDVLADRPVVESLDDAVRVVEDTINATSDRFGRWHVPTSRTGRAVVEALIGDPVLIQHADGTVTSSWPNDTATAALVSREALDSFVAEVSRLRRTLVEIRTVLAAPGALEEPCVHPGCAVPRGDHDERVRMHTWRGAP